MATNEFKVQIRERTSPSSEYKRPELLNQAIAEIEAEVAAERLAAGSDTEDESSSYDSDEEEDDDANLLTPAVDSQIFKTIAAIQAKDPRVYESSTNFFKHIDTNKPEKKSSKTKEPVIKLKDYERDILLKHGGFVNEQDESVKTKTHQQEQEDLRNAFKNAADSDDADEDDDGFLTKKNKSSEENEAEENAYRKFLLENMKDDAPSAKAFEEWSNFKQNPNVDREEAFLMDYVLNRGWVDKKGDKVQTLDEIDKEKEEEYLDDVDRFESKYNFRFEEEGASTIKTYSREVEGSVRRKESKRAKRRANERARKEALKQQKMEELKQKKNQKMKEIHDKLKDIRLITGNKAVGLENIDLDGDFDPSIFDAQMDNVFDDDYYNDQEGGLNEKPVWDDDIETGLPDEDIMDADYLPGGDKYEGQGTTKKSAATEVESKKRKFNDLMDEYYALNYEDVIGGDLYTRFKYARTEPEDYGLTAEEILLAEDAELNKYVGMKSLAPYRPQKKKERDDNVFEKNQKKKKKMLTKHVKSVSKELEKEQRKLAKAEVKASKKHKSSKNEGKKSTKKHKKSKH
ncbi:KRI1-like family C-terminal-domain-containing protein [Parasitella parasitica]|nr:KRI1-like family C-terminal-domain-containing protein [Parasitella parasitica]